MGSLKEKATSRLELVDLSKQNFKRTFDSLQENANSLLLLSVQWKEIDSFFDSTKSLLEERAKELEAMEESIKRQALELEAKEKDISLVRESFEAKLSDLEKKEEALMESMEIRRKESDEKVKELEEKAKELELKVNELEQQRESVGLEFEPLVSLLGKKIGTSVSMPTNCSTLCLSGHATDLADGLVKRNEGLARVIQYVDPAKLVLDAIQGCFKEYLDKDFGEADDRVVNSCVVLLEKLMQMKLRITREVKQEASQLGIDWIDKAITNQNNESLVLGCLLFLAAYGLAFVTTREVLFDLLERFLMYEQAPRLFRRLGLENKVSGVVETLKNKGEYLATLRFICEFQLSKLCPGWRPGSVLHEFLKVSGRAAQVTPGTENSMEAHKARREKRKEYAVMALDCIREKKAESIFPANALKQLRLLAKNDSTPSATEPVHKSCEEGQNTANAVEKPKADSAIPYEQENEAKRQRLIEPITPFQNSTGMLIDAAMKPIKPRPVQDFMDHDLDLVYLIQTQTKDQTN